jgi:hypothetical protein
MHLPSSSGVSNLVYLECNKANALEESASKHRHTMQLPALDAVKLD